MGVIPAWAKTGLGIVFIGAFIFGAFASDAPLVRVACIITISASLLVLLLVKSISTGLIRRLRIGVWLLAASAFVLLVADVLYFGGGALNGRIEGESCYLEYRGTETSATCQVYYTIAALETLVFVLWPVGFILAFSDVTLQAEPVRGISGKRRAQ